MFVVDGSESVYKIVGYTLPREGTVFNVEKSEMFLCNEEGWEALEISA